MSDAKAELGRYLFYDARLSVNSRGSCAGYHLQRLAFTDARPRAVGVTGQVHPYASMSLVNVAYNRSFTWTDPNIITLEQQIRIPMFNTDPVELGLTPDDVDLIARIGGDAVYQSGFEKAFPHTSAAITVEHTIKALASFVRSIVAADSPFDRLVFRDDRTAMSASAQLGMRLFFPPV